MKIEKWIEDISDSRKRERILELRQRYEFLSRILFSEFEPTRKSPDSNSRDFMQRLENWLNQFDSEEEQRTAFESIEYLFFAGPEEFYELYRCAHQLIQRWVLGNTSIDPFGDAANLNKEMEKVWFCPITDSFRINSFLHLTGSEGKQYRPDWYSLSKFSSKKHITEFIASEKIDYLVLLEDFIGSGKQASGVVEFVTTTVKIPTLIVPLIISEPGLNIMEKNLAASTLTAIEPVVVLPSDCLVRPTPMPSEPLLFQNLRNIMAKHYSKLGKNLSGKEYGFGKIGSLAVTFSNCPNNTLPIYHQSSKSEIALFPRLSRPWSPK